jgi:hypothetical protein
MCRAHKFVGSVRAPHNVVLEQIIENISAIICPIVMRIPVVSDAVGKKGIPHRCSSCLHCLTMKI